jgi:hypothetical protein
MPAFLAPVIGVAGGVALGYILDHTFGDSDYTGREMFVDAATGAVGGGLVSPVMRVGSRANKVIRHSGRQGYKVGAGATESILIAGYVSKPMISRPARMELLAGTAASLVYDIAYGKSPEVRSERNASDVTSGGTSPGIKIPSSLRDPSKGFYKGGKWIVNPCKPGHVPRKIRGRWVCVKK